MSLTGSGFLFLVAALTVVAFVTLVVVWPALAGHGPVTVASRVGMLLLVNLLVLLTAATQLNAAFLFFADWTDLRGAFGGAPTVTAVARGGTAPRAASHAVAGTAARAATRLPPLPAGVGSAGVINYTVKGAASGLTG